MIANANLVFLKQEQKEFEKKDGTKEVKHYGHFVQEDSDGIFRISLSSPDQKFEKYKSYSLKLKIQIYDFKKQDGSYRSFISYSQAK